MLDTDVVRSIIDYDPLSGVFTKKSTGKILGCKHSKGYIVISVKGNLFLAHRLAWSLVNGDIGEYQIDHINHNKTDNRLSNLRLVSNKENHKNKGAKNGKVLGVNWYKPYNMWRSRIMVDGKDINLGYFKDYGEAFRARKNAEAYYGFHENHGKEI